MMKKVTLFLLILCLAVLITCDHGLAPPQAERARAGLSGAVYFSNWPPADSIRLLKIVFFKSFPPQNIVDEILSGNAATYPPALTDGLPLDVDTVWYEVELQPETYAYIAVAQQFGPDVFRQWRAVGQYNSNPGDSLPSAVTVLKDSVLQDINIQVDFNNLPSQFIEAP